MPVVKRLKQKSETQSKASYIYGHFWDCVGILTETAEKLDGIVRLLRSSDSEYLPSGTSPRVYSQRAISSQRATNQ